MEESPEMEKWKKMGIRIQITVSSCVSFSFFPPKEGKKGKKGGILEKIPPGNTVTMNRKPDN